MWDDEQLYEELHRQEGGAQSNVVVTGRTLVSKRELSPSDRIDGTLLSSEDDHLVVAIQDAISTWRALCRYGTGEGENAGPNDKAGEPAAEHAKGDHGKTEPVVGQRARKACACRSKHGDEG